MNLSYQSEFHAKKKITLTTLELSALFIRIVIKFKIKYFNKKV